MNPDIRGTPQIDWGQMKMWQVWDPIPWWILDREKLEQILSVQLEFKLEAMKQQVKQMEKIHKIVVGR